MLERLVQLRWLRRSGRDYELGMRLVELGSLAVHQDRLVRAAADFGAEMLRQALAQRLGDVQALHGLQELDAGLLAQRVQG